jgi:arylsulfatase A-like enzyme
MAWNMYSRIVIFVALIAAAIGTCDHRASAAGRTASQPNIVMVLIDDMGWGDFSCFGNKNVETTNIDRLASEGIRFEQFYVNSPICSPSRTAISTGHYPMRWHITSYLNNRVENERRGIAQWLDPKAPMLPRILNNTGYATGHFGKWHMGGQRDVGDAPLITQYGFDESLTSFEGLGPRVLPLLDAYDGKEPQKYSLGSDTLGHGPFYWEKRDKVTKSFTDAAIEFIDKAHASGRPFYVNLWPDDVHSPFFPPKERRGNESKRERYWGVLKTMDDQLGALFDHIRGDPSLRDNTIVLVFSDNGPEDGAGSAGPLRGKKGMLYEGGVRSPLIVWAPGLQASSKAGTVNDSSIFAAIDFAPSLLAIAGVAKPAGVQFDGEPLNDVLLGSSTKSREKPLFFRRPPDRQEHSVEGNLPDLAVRDGNWKLLCEYDGSKPQLYNLEKDAGEKVNVADQNSDVVSRLTTAVLEWNDSMPADNGATYAALRKPAVKNRTLNRQR